MFNSRRSIALILGLFALAGQPETRAMAQGSLVMLPGVEEGSSIFRALALAFREEAEGLLTVPPPIGSGNAVADVIADRAEFARINRALFAHERAAGLDALPVFDSPVLVLAHTSVSRRTFSVAEIEALRDGKIRNWRSLGGNEMPVRFAMLQDAGFERPGKTMSERSDFLRSRDVEAVVRRVPGSIGLVPGPVFGEADITERQVENLSIREENYPLRSTTWLVYRPQSLSPEARRFLTFLHSARARDLAQAQRARWLIR
ncbi:hypothetical protein MCEMSEM23_01829 [Rhabdaerophilaceae bacterium]